MKIIRARDMVSSPWKNSGGVTTEIAIEPATASLGELNFLWRLSRAEVRSDGPFSQFLGYDRLLMILGPDDLRLNEVAVGLLSPVSFAGEKTIDAGLVGNAGFTFDLGVIFRRGLSCEMSVLTTADDSPQSLFVDDHVTDLCVVAVEGGSVAILNQQLDRGDALIVAARDLKLRSIDVASVRSEASTVVAICLGSTRPERRR